MRTLKIAGAALTLLALPALTHAQTEEHKVYMSWTPKPTTLPAYGTNKPVTRLADVLAKHKGEKSWSEDIVQTERFTARYIQMAPGEKTRTQFWGDDRVNWVVWSGQIRFSIHGQKPFIASKGFLVQVPFRVPYSMETVGSEPSLRFEVTHAGHYPSYPANASDKDANLQPPKVPGQHYIKVSYPPTLVAGGMGSYDEVNKPYFDFLAFTKQHPNGDGPKLGHFVADADNQTAIIRGRGKPTPSPTNRGHFHENNDEFWFILEGKCEYLIEDVGLVQADAGDVVFVPPGRWHRAAWTNGQMDTRYAYGRNPTITHNYGEDANGTQ
jgi:mannose-6-phosphate isomerase-like protein (cupin superfamily)